MAYPACCKKRAVIGADGLNNQLSGTGTANLNGAFNLDLSGAITTVGNSWTLVDVANLTKNFWANFTVTSTAGAFTEGPSGAEHGGVLAKLSRGDGARLALFTLTRGESGDNAIGPQLFDGLALIRTDELLNAGRYYGVDEHD